MKRICVCVLICLCFVCISQTERVQAIMLIDHSCTDLSEIPALWIQTAKDNINCSYQHTSHGSQLITGMNSLMSFPAFADVYTWTDSGSDGLNLDDDGIPGDCADLSTGDYIDSFGVTPWVTSTRNLLNNPDNADINVIMWSWCSINGHNAQRYVDNMEILVSEYPNVQFVFMTGHAEGQGENLSEGNVHYNNELIRQHCITYDRILFDFADIEAYDPDGNYYWDQAMMENLDYGGSHNWAVEWIAANPGSELEQLTTPFSVPGYPGCTECAHSDSPAEANLNCVLKGRATWWMMARIAGWQSEGPTPTPPPSTPTPNNTPVPTPTPGECGSTGVILWMPADMYYAGSYCSCNVTVCNMESGRIDGYPLFVILDINGSYFFAPDFSSYNSYLNDYPYFDEGPTVITVIPDFQWPAGTGSFYGAHWYAAMTDPGVTQLFGDMSSLEFSWDAR